MPEIEVIVESDYDGYFEPIAREIIRRAQETGKPLRTNKFTVSAGPYRSYGLNVSKVGDAINLDFYSALRTGFGSLTDDDLTGAAELLLKPEDPEVGKGKSWQVH